MVRWPKDSAFCDAMAAVAMEISLLDEMWLFQLDGSNHHSG
jgi:hypothetical protein